AISRGGEKEITSEEAKIQSKRELQTLSALYTSPAAIPYSPREPDSNSDNSQEFDQQPTIIPLPDHLKVRIFSQILSIIGIHPILIRFKASSQPQDHVWPLS